MKSTPAIIAIVTSCLLLGACNAAPGGRMWNSFNEYTKKGDYKAFAATSSNPGADASSLGYTWEASTVERAVKGALEGCEKGREQQMTTPSCRVIYLGNRRIDAYSRDELAKVQKEYQAKPTAFR